VPAPFEWWRNSFALAGPNLRPQRLIVSLDTTMPRSDNISSTIRRLKGKRKYSQTAWAMICGG
jgi:hypothetical protein